jgi:hypothetical protein
MRAHGLRGALAIVVAAAAFSGVESASPSPAPSAQDRTAIQRLLDERAAALMNRDRDAFMASVANVSPAFHRRQNRFFEWTASVPFASYELEAEWERQGDLIRPSDRARYVTAEAATLPVTEERYRIKGFDGAPAIEDMYYTFVRIDDRWLIAEDTDLDDLALYSARHLWDFGPVYARLRGRFLLIGHPCRGSGAGADCAPIPDDFLALANAAVERVDFYWRVPWRHRTVVLIPASARELKRMLQATFDVRDFVAFAYSTVDSDEGIDYTGHRVVLNPGALDGRPGDRILSTLAHELLHIATRRTAGPFVPVFVDEGIAEYVGHDADADSLAFFNSEAAAGLFNGLLPEDFEFTTGSGVDIFRSYQKAQSAVRFFIGEWGINRFTRFYRRLGSVGIEPGTARFHVDRALRRTIGVGFDAFQRAWADSIDLGGPGG